MFSMPLFGKYLLVMGVVLLALGGRGQSIEWDSSTVSSFYWPKNIGLWCFNNVNSPPPVILPFKNVANLADSGYFSMQLILKKNRQWLISQTIIDSVFASGKLLGYPILFNLSNKTYSLDTIRPLATSQNGWRFYNKCEFLIGCLPLITKNLSQNDSVYPLIIQRSTDNSRFKLYTLSVNDFAIALKDSSTINSFEGSIASDSIIAWSSDQTTFSRARFPASFVPGFQAESLSKRNLKIMSSSKHEGFNLFWKKGDNTPIKTVRVMNIKTFAFADVKDGDGIWACDTLYGNNSIQPKKIKGICLSSISLLDSLYFSTNGSGCLATSWKDRYGIISNRAADNDCGYIGISSGAIFRLGNSNWRLDQLEVKPNATVIVDNKQPTIKDGVGIDLMMKGVWKDSSSQSIAFEGNSTWSLGTLSEPGHLIRAGSKTNGAAVWRDHYYATMATIPANSSWTLERNSSAGNAYPILTSVATTYGNLYMKNNSSSLWIGSTFPSSQFTASASVLVKGNMEIKGGMGFTNEASGKTQILGNLSVSSTSSYIQATGSLTVNGIVNVGGAFINQSFVELQKLKGTAGSSFACASSILGPIMWNQKDSLILTGATDWTWGACVFYPPKYADFNVLHNQQSVSAISTWVINGSNDVKISTSSKLDIGDISITLPTKSLSWDGSLEVSNYMNFNAGVLNLSSGTLVLSEAQKLSFGFNIANPGMTSGNGFRLDENPNKLGFLSYTPLINATYTIPILSGQSNVELYSAPMVFFLDSGARSPVLLSSFHTNVFNKPLPLGVLDFLDPSNTDVSPFAIKRFWYFKTAVASRAYLKVNWLDLNSMISCSSSMPWDEKPCDSSPSRTYEAGLRMQYWDDIANRWSCGPCVYGQSKEAYFQTVSTQLSSPEANSHELFNLRQGGYMALISDNHPLGKIDFEVLPAEKLDSYYIKANPCVPGLQLEDHSKLAQSLSQCLWQTKASLEERVVKIYNDNGYVSSVYIPARPKIWSMQNNQLHITAPINGLMEVYNPLGQLLLKLEILEGENKLIDWPWTGWNLLRISGADGLKEWKVVNLVD